MRVGIFGGTFNPPHLGHLICAQEARSQLDLDSVTLVPAAEAPHKQIELDPGGEERYELCRLAAEAEPWLEASRNEIDRGGTSYTVDTLRALHEARPEDELFLLLGGDAAAELTTWRNPEGVLALATLAVAERSGADERRVMEAIGGLRGSERVTFFSMPGIDISSTMVRERVAAGRPIRFLVPDRVADRIESQGLYREAALPRAAST